MKAAVVRDFDKPLVVQERPDPEVGPGQVRVRVEASGLCHTGIHAAHGDRPIKPTPPFVPRHEGVAEGRTKIIRQSRPLTAVNDCIAEVLGGEVKARIVFDLDSEG